MKKSILFLLTVLLFNNLFSQEYIFKFKVNSKDELNKLTKIISVDEYHNGEVTAYANQKEFDTFKTLGYDYEILPHPSQAKTLTMATTVAQMASWDRYPTFEVLNQMIDQFATDYPNICRVETLGLSEAGRPIKIVKITDNPDNNEQEPEFYYTGQMHGDEIVDYIMFLRLIDYMLSNYGTDTRVTNLINNYEIWINPLSNPDGTYAGGNSTVSGATRSNYHGVDLNRNFPSPNTPNPSGQNENEIQMQIAFADAHHFVMSANTHSGIELVNFPWDSWTSSQRMHADHDWWYHVSRNYADEVHLNAPSSYMNEYDNGVTHGGDWYVVDGSRQDNMGYYKYCREVTLELSHDKMLDCGQLPAHWTYNRDAMLGYIEECLYGFNGTVKNTSNEPLNAKIEISGHDIDNSEVYTDPVNGDYYRPIEPGTYNVTYSSYGYISQTHSVTVTDWETTTIKNVILSQASVVNITGNVIEEGSNNPLQGVKIEVLNTPISPVYTDAAGDYTVENVMEDIYDIKASLAGYTSVTQTVDISNTTVVDFILPISTAESFETGIPSYMTSAGNLPWTRVSTGAFDGTYCMKSGAINHSETSVMEAELNILSAGDISFYKKVSSESGYDFLKFYIDGAQQGSSWSGTVNWSQETFSVTTGIHTFKWVYSKDGSASSGSDCAWVDYIEFPQYEEPPVYTVTFNVTDGSSPIENANINFNSQNILTNASGQAVFSEVSPGNNLPWTVSKTGYDSESGTLTITNENLTQNVVLTETITYTVTFNVDDGANPIEGANVNFDSHNITTDATGQAVFNNVENQNNSPYTVTKSGFNNYNGTLTVNNANVTENITMSVTSYTVIFTITDGTNRLQGANVNFNSQDILTNASGQAVFEYVAAANNIPYSITKTGYSSFNGQLTVSNQNIDINIPLNAVSVDVLLSLSNIKISPNPFSDYTSFEFSVKEKTNVFLGIYSYTGQLIAVLNDKELDAGTHKLNWTGKDASGQTQANGIYFCRLIYSGKSKTEKIILIR
jgi:hypothetical protein